MKKILIAIGIATMSLLATSCQDWLYVTPTTGTDSNVVFNDEERAEMFVLGCYRGLIQNDLFYQMGMGDGILHTTEANNNSKAVICNWHYNPTSGPFTLTGIYKEQYRIIEACNVAISNLSKMEQTDKVKALTGEAMTIRAFAYHHLIRVYGDVPAVFAPLSEMDPKDENTFYPKRASRDEVYDRIVADLRQAAEWVPWKSESGYSVAYERLDKQGVLGLLSRIALYAGGYSLRWNLETGDPSTLRMALRPDQARVRELYEIADDALEQIIGKGEHRLIQASSEGSGFYNLFYNFCQRDFAAVSDEMIFALAQYGATTNSQFNTFAQPGSRGGVYGSIKAMQVILPTYYLSFDAADTRRDVSVTSYSIYFPAGSTTGRDPWVDCGTTYSSLTSGKFRLPWCVAPQAAASRNLDIPILRYSDVLLMYAETQNWLNGAPTAAAQSALKQVRERAGIGSMAIPTDGEAFMDALVQERKWEFSSEFQMRTDLIRWNRIADEVVATQQAMKDLSDRAGQYADVATYRIYKYQLDAQKWGDPFLAIDYVDITDPAEEALLDMSAAELEAMSADQMQTMLRGILANHGITVASDEKWYPANMFQAYTHGYNNAARKKLGFTQNALQIEAYVYGKPTGRAENGGTYPVWIAKDNTEGIYFGFERNKSELLPFANISAGHPMVDNPNLTQHPGYAN